MRSPQTISGRVWIEQHFQHLQRWMLSARRDEDELREAGRALGYLLGREPAYARETRRLALHLAMSTWMAGVPGVVEDVVRTGLDADLMDAELREEPTKAAEGPDIINEAHRSKTDTCEKQRPPHLGSGCDCRER